MYERGKAGSIGSGIGCDEITSRRLGAAVRDIETRANIASYPWAGKTWRQIGSGSMRPTLATSWSIVPGTSSTRKSGECSMSTNIEVSPAVIRKPVQHRRSGSARSEEHTSELQSLMRISYAVFCLEHKKKNHTYQYSS